MELPQGLVQSEGVADGQEALFVLKQQINRILNHLRGGCQGPVEQSYFLSPISTVLKTTMCLVLI